jgi:glycosyltransferase involved in cell wall biosynthesis
MDLIDALHLLLRQSPICNASLDIVGEGADRRAFEKAIAAHGITDRVRFLGWISSTTDINHVFRNASVVIVPSIFPEGVPRVIDEAIVRSIPVISTPVGGIEEEFPNGEVVFAQPRNPEALAELIRKVVEDDAVRALLAARSSARRLFLQSCGSAAAQHSGLLNASSLPDDTMTRERVPTHATPTDHHMSDSARSF